MEASLRAARWWAMKYEQTGRLEHLENCSRAMEDLAGRPLHCRMKTSSMYWRLREQQRRSSSFLPPGASPAKREPVLPVLPKKPTNQPLRPL